MIVLCILYFIIKKKHTLYHTYHKKAFYLRQQDHDIEHKFYNLCIAMHMIEYEEPYLMLDLYMMGEL